MNDAGLLWALLTVTGAGGGRFHEVGFTYREPVWSEPDPHNGQPLRVWLPAGDRRRFEAYASEEDCVVSAVPRLHDGQPYVGTGEVLWVRLETAKHAEALAAFARTKARHGGQLVAREPTLVLREGATPRRVALWALDRALDMEWLERANKRLAHKLGTKKKFADPEFALSPPGTVLRAGRRKAVVVHVEHRGSDVLFEPRSIVGGLRDAPVPRDWREEA